MSQDYRDMSALLNACALGDTIARRYFQEEYGKDIYNFPVKIYGLSSEEAGDYYVYVFEHDRIFSRLKTFEGRNSIQFRTFLSYYVLKHLFIEWRRTCKEIESISLQTLIDETDDGQRTLEDILPSPTVPETPNGIHAFVTGRYVTLHSLTAEGRLYLKLLSLLEYDLSAEEVRLLATISKRTIQETLALLAEIQDTLRRKDEKIAGLRDELDSVWGWIVLRQNELQAIHARLRALSTVESIVDTEKLRARQVIVERSLAKRISQHERVIAELRTFKLTTPYKDIARLMNSTIGTVSSRIFRLREQLLQALDERGATEGEEV